MQSDAKPVRKYTVTEARENFKDVVNEVVYTGQPAVVTKHGEEAVAVVPYDVLALLVKLEAFVDVEKAQKALIEAEAGNAVTIRNLKKKLGLK